MSLCYPAQIASVITLVFDDTDQKDDCRDGIICIVQMLET